MEKDEIYKLAKSIKDEIEKSNSSSVEKYYLYHPKMSSYSRANMFNNKAYSVIYPTKKGYNVVSPIIYDYHYNKSHKKGYLRQRRYTHYKSQFYTRYSAYQGTDIYTEFSSSHKENYVERIITDSVKKWAKEEAISVIILRV